MATPTYNLIQTYTVSADNTISTITFNNFSTYKDLSFKTFMRTNDTGSFQEVQVLLNSVSMYNRQYLTTNGTSPGAGVGNDDIAMYIAYTPASGSAAYYFSQYDVYLTDFSNNSYIKALSSDGTVINGTTGGQFAVIYAGSPATDTGAVTSVSFKAASGKYFMTGTVISIYGISNS